jgi:serine/threonine protein kinase
MEELIGSTIAHYKLQEIIGRGQRATVFKAQADNTDRPVAVKLIPLAKIDTNAAFEQRFKQHLARLEKLIHPNILAVNGYGIEAGYVFIETQLIERGQSLRQRLQRRSLGQWRTIELLKQMAGGLGYAHERGVLHLDLSPDNILLNAQSYAWATNFGLAELFGKADSPSAYHTPEQITGGVVDQRADIYALGVMMYEIFTGAQPYQSPPTDSMPPASPRTLNENLSESLAHVTLRALAPKAQDRYPSAVAFIDALKTAADDDSFREPYVTMLGRVPPPGHAPSEPIQETPPPAPVSAKASRPRPEIGPPVLIPLPKSTSTPLKEETSPTVPENDAATGEAQSPEETPSVAPDTDTANALHEKPGTDETDAEDIAALGDGPLAGSEEDTSLPKQEFPGDEGEDALPLGVEEGEEKQEEAVIPLAAVSEPPEEESAAAEATLQLNDHPISLEPDPLSPTVVPLAGQSPERESENSVEMTPEEPVPHSLEIVTTPPPAVALPTITHPAPGKNKKKDAWRMPVWATVLGIGAVLVIIVWIIFAFSLNASFSSIQATGTAVSQAALTVEESPTATATATELILSPTATQTRVPTSTPFPPTETSQPPTETPLPPTGTPVPPTNTPFPPTETPTPEASPTPEPPAGEWTLLNPSPGDPASDGAIIFEWSWSEELLPGQGFEIRVWRAGEPLLGAHDAVADNQNDLIKQTGGTSYSMELDIKNALGVQDVTGSYLWAVALVQISPEYLDLQQQSEPGTLEFLGSIGIEDLVDNPEESVDNPDSSPQDGAENGGEPSEKDVDNLPPVDGGEGDGGTSP